MVNNNVKNHTKLEAEDIQEMILDGIEGVANLQLPDPYLRKNYLDEQNRIYRLNTEVNDGSIDLVDLIIKCNQEDRGIPVQERKPIRILISSPGGDIVVGWNIIQAIQTSKTPVWTIDYTYAYSMAAEILVAGHKRFAMPGSCCLIHKGSTSISGEHDVVESAQKHFKRLETKMKNFLFDHTHITPALYNKKASSDMYYDEEQMLEMGIIDSVVTNFDEVF